MKSFISNKAGTLGLLLLLSVLFMCPAGVLAADDQGSTSETAESPIGVEYRGHVENYGNMPKPDGSFISGPEAIGTRGQGLRVEGFWIGLTGDLPEGASICYQVHVENEGWMEPVKDGAFAGTQGQGLRVESIKIWLENMPGYDVYYHGHVQNVGNIPTENEDWGWVKNGEEMGTTGSGLRLEELAVKIVKKGADLTAYNALLDQIAGFNQADYTAYSWNHLQTVLSENEMTDQNNQDQVDEAVTAIQSAVDLLENIPHAIVYDQAGVYGPASGEETVDQDVIIMSDGVTLQNMNLTANLIVTEDVGDGDVTLNNITVAGDTRFRGGGIHSIHINGGQYKNIIIQKLATGQLRIVTTDVLDENGMPLIIAEDAVDDTVIIDGQYDSVTIYAPGAQVILAGDDTSVGTMRVAQEAQGSRVTVGTGTEIGNLEIGATSEILGNGRVRNASVNANGVVFEKRPDQWQEEDNLDVPPVMPDLPTPTPGGGGGGGGSVTPSQSGPRTLSPLGPIVLAIR